MESMIASGLALVLSLVAALLAAEEAASSLLSSSRIARLAESDRPGASALLDLTASPHKLRATAALFSGAAYVGVAAAVALWVTRAQGLPLTLALLVGGVFSAAFVFSIAQTLPRTIAVQNPEGVALRFAGMSSRVVLLGGPIVVALEWPWSRLIALVIGDKLSKHAWQAETDSRVLGTDEPQSQLEVAEEALLEAVSDFAEKVVREVMVPRTDMTCLPDTATARQAVEVIQSHGISRLPVYHETLDDIRGVLYAKDLLPAILQDAEVSPLTLVRKPYFVPETKPVQQLLVEMRDRTHIAIVADEYGGTAGLVTIEDLLEEIVGEIQDEFDSEQPLVESLPDGRHIVDGRLPVDDLNEMLGTAIESDSDTVGGVVIEAAGRIPEIGDEVLIEGLTFRVAELQGARIRQLVVEPAKKSDLEG